MIPNVDGIIVMKVLRQHWTHNSQATPMQRADEALFLSQARRSAPKEEHKDTTVFEQPT